MRYPKFLRENDTIGAIAPSFGVSGPSYEMKYAAAKARFEEMGYKVVEAPSIFNLSHARSNTAEKRAAEFMEMYLDKNVDFMLSVAGGEIMCEMLDYVDFEKLKAAEPKWFMGVSDNTIMTFLLPVLCDTAAIYGSNFGTFGMRKWDKAVKETYQIITGKRRKQKSYRKYEIKNLTKREGHELDGYNKKIPVVYKSLDDRDVQMKGRLIGGCLDVLLELVGTRFDKVKEFTEKYAKDGIIWYLEACDLNVLAVTRGLWQLRNAGWFNHCKGIIVGRPIHTEEIFDIDVRESLYEPLKDLNVPVIYDADFGHLPPCWSLISGCYAAVEKTGDKGSITYYLK